MKKLDSEDLTEGGKNIKSLGILSLLFISAIIIGVAVVGYIRSNSGLLYPSSRPSISKADADKFCLAVKNGKEKEAILLASKIIPDDSPELPQFGFIHFFSSNGLGTLMLTSGFNHFDYLRWKDAFEIQKILKSYAGRDDPLIDIFREILEKGLRPLINDQLSFEKFEYTGPGTVKPKLYASAIDIWNSGNASLDEMMRLFSAMAYQLGYDVQIVSIYDESRKRLHTVSEIQKKGRSYIADFRYGKIWRGMTVFKLIKDPESVKDVWPEEILNSADAMVYMLPAEAQDYKLYNYRLSKKLVELGMKNIPRFGENPQQRIAEYIRKYSNKSEKRHYSYWNFPFESLMSSPNFPEEWKLPQAKPEKKR